MCVCPCITLCVLTLSTSSFIKAYYYTAIYLSACYFVCVRVLLCVRILLYVSAYTTKCVIILLHIRAYMCPHTTIRVLILLCVGVLLYVCRQTTKYVSAGTDTIPCEFIGFSENQMGACLFRFFFPSPRCDRHK